MLAHIDAEKPLSEYPGRAAPELEPLTTKPLLAVENGPGGIDLALEAELAELDDEEAAAFRDGGVSALDEVVRRLHDALDLVTFFTAGEKDTRAWTLRNGQTALDAAETIHSDIARGFIRCEVIDWKDLVESGSHAEASRRGLQRLEGKTYVVRDGDVLNIRFNVWRSARGEGTSARRSISRSPGGVPRGGSASSLRRFDRPRSGDRVELVRVVEDCRLGRPRSARVVVDRDAMEELGELRSLQSLSALLDQPQAEMHVAEQAALVGRRERRPARQLERPTSWTSAAAITSSLRSRGWSCAVSRQSVATPTVCSSSPPA